MHIDKADPGTARPPRNGLVHGAIYGSPAPRHTGVMTRAPVGRVVPPKSTFVCPLFLAGCLSDSSRCGRRALTGTRALFCMWLVWQTALDGAAFIMADNGKLGATGVFSTAQILAAYIYLLHVPISIYPATVFLETLALLRPVEASATGCESFRAGAAAEMAQARAEVPGGILQHAGFVSHGKASRSLNAWTGR